MPNSTPICRSARLIAAGARLITASIALLTLANASPAQSNAWTAGAAGGATASLLGSGLSSGAGSTSPASAGTAGSGSGAAVEINIMVYKGLSDIAQEVAVLAAQRLCDTSPCPTETPILVEDSTSANQIGLYETANGYYDQLSLLHKDLELSFSLKASTGALTLDTSKSGSKGLVMLTNAGTQTLNNLQVALQGPGKDRFQITTDTCTGSLDPNVLCNVSIQFLGTPPGGDGKPALASLNVTVLKGRPGHVAPETVQIVQLSGTGAKGAPAPAPKAKEGVQLYGLGASTAEIMSLAATGLTGAGTNPAAAAASTPPQWATNFGTIGTAIEALKSGMSYTASAAQPTTQSFEVLLENELQAVKLRPYTSTSALDLGAAETAVTKQVAEMLAMANDINNWSAQCKPAAGASDQKTTTPSNPSNPECKNSEVLLNLATAQQMTTAYFNLLTANDGAGNTVLLDVLRGAVLASALQKEGKTHIPTLQVTVAAAGGSTRVNAFFLLNIFYLPKPSYNGGAVVTFELRDPDNQLLQSGARVAFFDYNKKWTGNKFSPVLHEGAGACSTKESATFCLNGSR